MSQDTPSRSDRRREIITPEGLVLPFMLASRGARLGAIMLDFLIITVVLIIVAVGLIYAGVGALGMDGTSKGRVPDSALYTIEFLVIVYIIVLFLFRHGYFLFFELGPRGATPGKRMTGIRVAARDGARLTPQMVLARNLLRDVEITLPLSAFFALLGDGITAWVAGAWLLVFVLFPFINNDRLRPGDLVAGTWVVEAPRRELAEALSLRKPLSEQARQAAADRFRFSESELAVYGEYELQTLERVLRDSREDALIAVHEAICRKIGQQPRPGEEQEFLEAYYTQLRGRLEAGLRMGRRKADKFA